jgi:transcriptional regulator with XRE-family HTH domain
MVRTPLTEDERLRGLALGRVLQRARAGRSAAEVAHAAGISVDTLRKIERGAIATPAFFTVAALAKVLRIDLAALADTAFAETGRAELGHRAESGRRAEPGDLADAPRHALERVA